MTNKTSSKRKIALVGLLVLVAAVGWSFLKRPLPVSEAPGIPLPEAPVVEGVAVSVIPTAEMTSLAAFSVRGGSLSNEYTSSVAAVLIEHPQGKFLVDAGAGRDIDSHLATTPLLLRAVTNLNLLRPTVDALEAGGLPPRRLSGIWLTHGHWDHVSGLADFGSQVPVWLTDEELTFLWQDETAGKLFRELQPQANLRIRTHQFTDGAYGPFPWSKDYFGDGSVILLPLAGHTPGSIAVLVNLASGKRYLFIGDTAWAKEGFEWPAEKPFLARSMADDDAAMVRDQLVFLHKIQEANPDLVIVPAHDARVYSTMAQFPNREK